MKRTSWQQLLIVLAACQTIVSGTTFGKVGGLKSKILKSPTSIGKKSSSLDSVLDISRGGGKDGNILMDAASALKSSMEGGKTDTLLLMMATALVPAVCKKINISPILGFLASGVALGPQGKNLIADLHTTEMLADLGVVLFLFEMGVHLSLKTLWEMRRTVFGLGGCQFLFTAAGVALAAKFCGLDTASQIVLGGGLALSSSAFVLQLLKDKNQMQTEYGKNSFGVLLLQDLAVVPLLVVTPLLAGSGDQSAMAAATAAIVKAVMALVIIGLLGTYAVPPLFGFVDKAKSQEAMIGVSMMTILGFSFLTEGLGLSNTLGAFLAGVLLSETPFNHDVEREVSPIRGILVGLFFFSVGFEIDLKLIASSWPLVSAVVAGILSLKLLVATAVCKVFGLPLAISQQIGFVLSQGGEFAFVAFRLARSLGIFDEDLTKLMLTSVSLTMALTPSLEELGSHLAEKLTPPPPPPPPSKKSE